MMHGAPPPYMHLTGPKKGPRHQGVYAGMEDVHMAEKSNEPRWLDENGDEVSKKQAAFR